MTGAELAARLVQRLQALNPAISFHGASFREALPPLADLSTRRQLQALAAQRRKCRNELLEQAIDEIGRPILIRGHGGWDAASADTEAFSIAHKGTVVLLAHAPLVDWPLLGIDLDNSLDGVDVDSDYVAPEGLPATLKSPHDALLAFSAKEALFKALDGQRNRPFEFSDLRLEWRAKIETHEAVPVEWPELMVRGSFVDDWVVTLACASTSLQR